MVSGLSSIPLSPTTTVSGPLVIATCAEFSVLILGRYLEERQRGLEPRQATDTAASRTGRAFFTSAVTTIGGFAVLIGSALPLLRDFGIIVTLNVAIALLAALVVMPPLAVWVDQRGWLGTAEQPPDERGVRLAAPMPGGQTAGMAAGAVGLVAAGVAIYATADTSTGSSSEIAFAATPLAEETAAPETTVAEPAEEPAEEPADDPDATDGEPAEEPADDPDATDGEPAEEPADDPSGPAIDPSTFPTDRPPDSDLLGSTLFDLLVGGSGRVGQGVDPAAANCTIQTASERFGVAELTNGLITADPAALDAARGAAADCGLDPAVVDGGLAEFSGG